MHLLCIVLARGYRVEEIAAALRLELGQAEPSTGGGWEPGEVSLVLEQCQLHLAHLGAYGAWSPARNVLQWHQGHH